MWWRDCGNWFSHEKQAKYTNICANAKAKGKTNRM